MIPIVRPLTVMAIFSLMAIFLHDIFFIGVIIMAFDVRSRYMDYKKFKDREWSDTMGRRFMKSFCSRGVAIGIWGDTAEEFFKAHGYKPYHILPDGFPQVFFKRKFWKSVFGV